MAAVEAINEISKNRDIFLEQIHLIRRKKKKGRRICYRKDRR